MISVTYTELRNNLATYMDRANDDSDTIMVTRQGKEPGVMMAARDYAGMTETDRLLRNPVNMKRLRASIADAEAGRFVEHDLKL